MNYLLIIYQLIIIIGLVGFGIEHLFHFAIAMRFRYKSTLYGWDDTIRGRYSISDITLQTCITLFFFIILPFITLYWYFVGRNIVCKNLCLIFFPYLGSVLLIIGVFTIVLAFFIPKEDVNKIIVRNRFKTTGTTNFEIQLNKHSSWRKIDDFFILLRKKSIIFLISFLFVAFLVIVIKKILFE